MNKVFKVDEFDKYAQKLLTKSELKELDKFIEDLKIDFNRGKPLRYSFLREKKIGSKRVFFLIYENICFILLVALSNKKTQQEVIDSIVLYLDEYKELIYEIYKEINKN